MVLNKELPAGQNIFDKYSAKRVMMAFFLFNVIFKLLLIPTNRAEYTDGILQITLFSFQNKLYPPFFTILVQILKPILRNPELAGRLVSALSSSILVFPIFQAGRYFFGRRSAFFAVILYTVSPMALRWSVHAMTDSLFSLLFFWAAWECLRGLAEDSDLASRHLIIATVLSVTATLSRYQGILLLPVLGLVLLIRIIKKRKTRGLVYFIQLLWILLPLWILLAGFRHSEQFVERSGNFFAQTLLNALTVGESFLAYSPYFMTWPICFLFLAGIFYLGWKEPGRRNLFFLSAYFCITILILQSFFSSFQSRYLLPLLPFVVIFAGRGAMELKKRWAHIPALWSCLMFITVVYSLGLGMSSLFLQRDSFGDLKDAALFVKELPPELTIYSNETYKDLGAVKMRFWSGREIKPLTNPDSIPPGSVVCITSAYGGMKYFTPMRSYLTRNRSARSLAIFEGRIVPILPDIMQEPDSHQNPLALTFRYVPQKFRTEVFLIP